MFYKSIDWMKKREVYLVAFLFLLFIIIRLPGLNIQLHQDEYKWPVRVNPETSQGIPIPHPPLSQFIYETAGYMVGFNENFRLVPLFFGAINIVLLYYFMRFMFGKREALVASVIWIIGYFSVLSSLMVDTDGEILPFFFLLLLISYYKVRDVSSKNRVWWGALMVASLILGFMVKVSFVLSIGAIIADFLWTKKDLITKRDLLKYSGFALAGVFVLVVLLLLVKYIFPFFDLSGSIEYWKHFFTLDRGWFQTAIQCIKAILFASPLLIVIPLFGSIKDFSKVKSLFFFILFSLLFYVVIFDFSIGALDKYLQLLVLPLTILATIVITPVLFSDEKRKKEFLLLGAVVALTLILLQSLPHSVPPLHPKLEWISRILSLKWNFLYVFSGGSGPLPFYISFLFIGLTWMVSGVLLLIYFFKPKFKKLILLFLIPICLGYNIVLVQEYFYGTFNGSSSYLLKGSSDFINSNDDITKVTVYNDNGGYEIVRSGKYRKRLYIDPKFDLAEKINTLNTYKEHYFVLDIPRIDPDTVYRKFFDSCEVIYNETDKKISATVYDCSEAPDLEYETSQ